ncbi:MAG: hypothetical protein ABI761_19905 [Saprospiraceae bacterium]
MRIVLICFILSFIQPSLAQAKELNLADLFFKNKTVVWQKTYSGIWDDAIPVQMELLSDGTNCRGYFYFGDDKDKYVLSGTIENNEIKLEEQDLHSNKTGQVILLLENNTARGTWYNVNRSYNASLDMHEGSFQEVKYWVRSYAPVINPKESMVILHKDFADQLNTNFYYKAINKTLFGTSFITADDNFSQEARLEDYLHHKGGLLKTWKVNDKRIDMRYTSGTTEYSQSLDLLNQVAISQETFADRWMAVDIKFPQMDKSILKTWFRNLIDSLLDDIQIRKRLLLENSEPNQLDRLSLRMSIWPQFDFLNGQWMSGMLNVKNSWDDATLSIPFMFDLKKGNIIQYEDLFNNRVEFEAIKSKWINQELTKLKTGSSLNYKSLTPEDFTLVTFKNEGLAFTAPFDITYGFRQIIIPYTALKEKLSPKYFPL